MFFPKKKLFLLFPFIINLLFILYIKFQLGESFLQYIDGSFFITQSEAFRKFGSVWEEFNLGNGSLNEIVNLYPRAISYFFLKLSLPIQTIQLLFYTFVFNLVFYTTWYFQNKSLKFFNLKNTEFASFFGTAFYTYNIFMTFLWNGGVGDQIFLFFASIPVFIYFALQLLLKDSFSWQDSLILSLLIGLNFNVIPFNLAFWLVIFTSLVVTKILIDKNFFSLKILLKFFVSLVLAVFVGAVFIFPLVILYTNPDPFSTSKVSDGYIFTIFGIPGLLQFFYIWSMNISRDGYKAYGLFSYFESLIGVVSSLGLWFLFLRETKQTIDNSSKKLIKFLFFFWLIAISSLFLAKGIQSPLAEVNTFIYEKIPLFGLFRTPDSKFGFPLISMISLFISYLLARSSKKIAYIIIFFVFLQILPFFTGASFFGTPAGQKLYTFPKEYIEIAEVINSEPGTGNVLFIPGDQVSKFIGNYYNQDILGKMLERNPIYSSNTRIATKSKKLVETLSENILEMNPGDYHIEFIVLRHDIYKYIDANHLLCDDEDIYIYRYFSDTVGKSPYLELALETKNFFLYRLKEKDLLQDTISFQSDNADYVTSSKKLSPSKYRLTIESSSQDPLEGEVVLRNSYNPLWRLSTDSKMTRLGEHKLYNDFGNAWNMQTTDKKEIVIEVEFILQKVYILSLFSTIISTSAVATFLIYRAYRKKM